MHHRALAVIPALLAAAVQAGEEPALAPAPAPAPGALALPYGEAPAELGTVAGPGGAVLATVAGSWTASHLHLRIAVQDAEHVGAAGPRALWSSDSVEIGLDLAGDGSGGLPPATTGVIGGDDLKVIVGLGEAGPALLVLASKDPAKGTALGEALRPGLAIARDAQRPEVMVYRLALPWSALGVAGGVVPAIGLDVQVNDRDAADADKTPWHWGGGLKNGFTAAAMQRLALGAPPAPFAAAMWGPLLAWTPGDRGTLHLGVRSDAPVAATLTLGGRTLPLSIPGGPGLRCHRLAIPALDDGAEAVIRLGDAPAVTARQSAPPALFAALQRRLAELAAAPGQHPLFLRHLDSLHALVVSDWARVLLNRSADPRRAEASVGHLRRLLAGLAGEAGQWQAYRDGRRSLLISYVSPHDQTLQYYYFGLPRDWDESKAYPLFFELHGAGDDHPLGGPASRLGMEAEAVALHGYDTPRVWAEIDRSGYWVHPFGRGNLGYAGIARIDVLEAYEHAHRLVRIDADRRYLYGFSMGGAGTTALAPITPSRWAACAAMGGAGSRGEPIRSYLLDNLAGLPFRLVIGADDPGAANVRAMRAALQARGLEPVYEEIPGLGHSYTAEMQRASGEWLKTHVRKRPARFTFATVDNLTGDCWGVRLLIDQGVAPRGAGGGRGPLRVVDESAPVFAKATVEISGQSVRIDSTGARQVMLDFDPVDGLGLQGEVVVTWNGAEAYRGPAKPVTLRP